RVPMTPYHIARAPHHFLLHSPEDIGTYPVARRLAAAYDAPLIAQAYSHLVIDCNRPTHVPSSIPTVSEDTRIPGNEGISPAERKARIDAVFRPYHAAIRSE